MLNDKFLLLKTYLKNPLVLFLIKGFVFYMLWDQLLYNFLITPAMHNWVILQLLEVCQWWLRLFYSDVSFKGFDLYIHGHDCVHVGIPCNGIDVMGVFACLILAFRATWLQRIAMIFSGVVLVFTLNVLRISSLAMLAINHHKLFDINHKYVFNFVLYGILLLIFSVWSSKVTGKKPPTTGGSGIS